MAKEKVKKSIFKRWWFWAIIVVIIIAIGANMGGNNDSANGEGGSSTATKSESKSDNSSSSSSSSPENKSSNKAAMSKDEFAKIKNGMTYGQVVKIVGSKGSVESETGESGSPEHTVIYTWDGDKGWGANANVTFQNEKVVNKAQFGVDSGSGIKITLDKFNQVKNGMSYEDVQKVLGGKGSVDSETGDKGSSDHIIMISYEGKEIGSNAILTFQGNKLTNKTQVGLK